MLLWSLFGQQWALSQSVNFDGENKLIYVAPGTSTIDVKIDLYSNWKEWARIYNNMKYLAAFRNTGGDPTVNGEYLGDAYFTINGWRVFVDHAIDITGVIFSDDYTSPLTAAADTKIVTNKVANLILGKETSATVTGAAIAQAVWDHLQTNMSASNSAGVGLKRIINTVDDNQALIIGS